MDAFLFAMWHVQQFKSFKQANLVYFATTLCPVSNEIFVSIDSGWIACFNYSFRDDQCYVPSR